jgi:hypothetical protein
MQTMTMASGPGGQPADVVGDLHQRHRETAQPGRGVHHGFQTALRGELVGRRDERVAGLGGDLRGDLLPETGRRIEPGADRCAAGGQLIQPRGRRFYPADGLRSLLRRGPLAGQAQTDVKAPRHALTRTLDR